MCGCGGMGVIIEKDNTAGQARSSLFETGEVENAVKVGQEECRSPGIKDPCSFPSCSWGPTLQVLHICYRL